MLKYSRQRESIKNFLMSRCDHPTAEVIYRSLRKDFPNISLGTVYRNLALLTELGEIQTISTGEGPDRFDGNVAPHYHFQCRGCGALMDLQMQSLEHINLLAQHEFSGEIDGHSVFFYGRCRDCISREKLDTNQMRKVIDRTDKKCYKIRNDS